MHKARFCPRASGGRGGDVAALLWGGGGWCAFISFQLFIVLRMLLPGLTAQETKIAITCAEYSQLANSMRMPASDLSWVESKPHPFLVTFFSFSLLCHLTPFLVAVSRPLISPFSPPLLFIAGDKAGVGFCDRFWKGAGLAGSPHS